MKSAHDGLQMVHVHLSSKFEVRNSRTSSKESKIWYVYSLPKDLGNPISFLFSSPSLISFGRKYNDDGGLGLKNRYRYFLLGGVPCALRFPKQFQQEPRYVDCCKVVFCRVCGLNSGYLQEYEPFLDRRGLTGGEGLL